MRGWLTPGMAREMARIDGIIEHGRCFTCDGRGTIDKDVCPDCEGTGHQ